MSDSCESMEWVAISFSRGIFLTQGSNLCLLHLLLSQWILCYWATCEAHFTTRKSKLKKGNNIKITTWRWINIKIHIILFGINVILKMWNVIEYLQIMHNLKILHVSVFIKFYTNFKKSHFCSGVNSKA